MAFVENATEIARESMAKRNPDLVNVYSKIISFLTQYPDEASQPKGKGAPAIGTTEYIEKQAHSFALSRNPTCTASLLRVALTRCLAVVSHATPFSQQTAVVAWNPS